MRSKLLHVHVVDGSSGTLLADIDATSTADGLAYYLRSRGLDPQATETSVRAHVAGQGGPGPDGSDWDTYTIGVESRSFSAVDPRGAVDWSIVAKVGP